VEPISLTAFDPHFSSDLADALATYPRLAGDLSERDMRLS